MSDGRDVCDLVTGVRYDELIVLRLPRPGVAPKSGDTAAILSNLRAVSVHCMYPVRQQTTTEDQRCFGRSVQRRKDDETKRTRRGTVRFFFARPSSPRIAENCGQQRTRQGGFLRRMPSPLRDGPISSSSLSGGGVTTSHGDWSSLAKLAAAATRDVMHASRRTRR